MTVSPRSSALVGRIAGGHAGVGGSWKKRRSIGLRASATAAMKWWRACSGRAMRRDGDGAAQRDDRGRTQPTARSRSERPVAIISPSHSERSCSNSDRGTDRHAPPTPARRRDNPQLGRPTFHRCNDPDRIPRDRARHPSLRNPTGEKTWMPRTSPPRMPRCWRARKNSTSCTDATAGAAAFTSCSKRSRARPAGCAPLQAEMARVIVGQRYLVDRLIVGLLTNGHVLLEGVPGLAKTLALEDAGRDARRARSFAACSSRPTCCPPTSSAP